MAPLKVTLTKFAVHYYKQETTGKLSAPLSTTV